MRSRLKIWILRWAVRDILNAVSIDELLRIQAGKVFIGKTELKPEEIATLKADAKNFEQTLLWKLMRNNLYWIANFKMMKEANWEQDMYAGRMMTLCIDTLEEFINKLKIL